MRRIASFGVMSATLMILGAGCSWPWTSAPTNPPSSPAGTYGELRQPPAAKAPTQQPIIPPEAANVPKPY